MNLRRNYIWLLPLLALLTAPLWWGTAGRLLAPRVENFPAITPDRQLLNTFVLHRVTLVQNRAGIDDIFIKADEVESVPGSDELEMKKVDGKLVGARRSLQITGGGANYDLDRQVLTVTDQVRLATTDGYHLSTELLRYFPRSGKVETDKMVSLDGAGIKMEGKGLLYDLQSGEFRIGGRVVVDLS